MSYTFDLVDFSNHNDFIVNNKKNMLDYSDCIEIDFREDDELYYKHFYQCKDMICDNLDRIIKEYPFVKDVLDPTKNNFIKSLINDGLSINEASAMGLLFILMMISNISK